MEYSRIIITGASSGLGAEFARALSVAVSAPCEMILIARRINLLEKLAQELTSLNSNLTPKTLCCDLSDPAARAALIKQLQDLSPAKTLLVNNAGLGDYGEFASSEPEKNNSLLQVNMLALVELTRALLPQMLKRGGDIINIASLAADIFLPDFALYAASKAFVASYSEALRLELKNKNIKVLAVCPGPVKTGFGAVAQRPGHDRGDMPLKQWFYTPAKNVVRASLIALKAGRARSYPSFKIWFSSCLLYILPLWLRRSLLHSRPRRVKQVDKNT